MWTNFNVLMATERWPADAADGLMASTSTYQSVMGSVL